ncbi:glycosyltransferase family 8 protein [Parasediminibacterium sp. JCM 36343]|uniref:glycosyltransferase family 8 protein n=1 Tax=Parasediminibacterium sp. JCM 36343 TaxID=3374279 RepID=UPI00397B68A2
MHSPQPLTVVVACDNHYLILLAALIKSIEANIRPRQPLNVYIIEDKVTPSNKEKLLRSVNIDITTLHWQKMEDVIPIGMQLPLDRSSYPLNIYMRLFIPYFIPHDIEKVLYLDVDMIVQADITTIFETDLDNHIVAAVLDPRIITFDNSWGGVLNYEALGLLGTTRYFNTGLLLMQTRKWREQDITTKIIECIDNNKKFANYPDQYGLNVVLANQWLELDSRWNHFSTIDTEQKPFLIHFVERKPIYQSYNFNEDFKKTFFFYLQLTDWKNFKPIGESFRYFKKAKNIWGKLKKMF